MDEVSLLETQERYLNLKKEIPEINNILTQHNSSTIESNSKKNAF